MWEEYIITYYTNENATFIADSIADGTVQAGGLRDGEEGALGGCRFLSSIANKIINLN
jgi:hypothetical protein